MRYFYNSVSLYYIVYVKGGSKFSICDDRLKISTLKGVKDDLCPSLSSSQLTLNSCHICACTCSCVYEYMCTCVWKPEDRASSSRLSTCFVETGSFLDLGFTSAVSNPQGWGATVHAALGLHSCLPLLLAFTWAPGFKLRPSCLRGKHFTDEAFSPPQISNSYIKIASTFIFWVRKSALTFNKL